MQRQRTLTVILWAIGIMGNVVAIQNLLQGAYVVAIIAFSLAPIGLLALFLNRKGHFYIAALMLSGLILFVIDYDICDVGGITGDLAVIAFPVLVVIGSLLLGKKGIYLFSLLSIISVAVISAM